MIKIKYKDFENIDNQPLQSCLKVFKLEEMPSNSPGFVKTLFDQSFNQLGSKNDVVTMPP